MDHKHRPTTTRDHLHNYETSPSHFNFNHDGEISVSMATSNSWRSVEVEKAIQARREFGNGSERLRRRRGNQSQVESIKREEEESDQ